MASFDQFGREVPDQTPVEVPLDFRRPLSLQEEIRRFVRGELSMRAVDESLESFEEADDFEVDDDEGDFVSPYEMTEMAEEPAFRDASDLTKPEPPPKDTVEPAKPADAPPAGASAPVQRDDKTLPLPGMEVPR